MKKRKIALALLLVILSMTACAEKKNETESMMSVAENGEMFEDGGNISLQNDISIEDLERHEETAVEDFTYSLLEEYAYISGYHGKDNLVVIPELIEGLPVKKVSGLYNSGVVGIKFADSVDEIAENCFFNDGTLQYVICGENLKKIGNQAFLNCGSMKEIQLNDGIEIVGDRALCTRSSQMADLYLPESIIEIGVAAFDMEGMVLLHVKAGSVVEQYCIDNKVPESFPDMAYVTE